MMQMALVAVGGAVGSVLRYALQKALNASFPTGTLAVNVLGCFAIGLLWALANKGLAEPKRLLLMTGFCGGFTTFSAFSLEGVQMLTAGRWTVFFLYSSSSVACGLLATFIGYKIFSA